MAKQLPSPADDEFSDADFLMTTNAEDVTLQQQDIDEQINSIMSEVGSDKNEVTFHFQVWRVLKDKADMAFLFKGFLSDLPIMERLRDEYDGGKFHIQVYRNKKRYRRVSVTVEAPKKSYVPPAQKNETAEILRAIADQQSAMHKQLVDTLMQVAGKPATPQPSQMDMMMGMVALMKGMKDIVGAPAPAPMVHDMNPDKYMDLFIRGMELGKDSGGSASGSNLIDVLRDTVKALPTLASMTQPTMPRPAPAPAPPSTVPRMDAPATPPVSPPAPEDSMTISDMIIKQNLGKLIEKAEADSDPTLYGDFIIDNVPEKMVREYILKENIVEELGKLDPRVLQHREWFLELRNHIYEVLTAPEEESDTAPHVRLDPVQQPSDDPHGDGGDTSNS
jgi:hypothetical protein